MHSIKRDTLCPGQTSSTCRLQTRPVGSSLKRLRDREVMLPPGWPGVRAGWGWGAWGSPVGPPRGGNGSYSHCSARRARGGGRGSGLRRAPREASYRRAAGRRTRCGAAPGRQPRHPITSSWSPGRRRHLRPRAREPRARLGPGAPPPRPPPLRGSPGISGSRPVPGATRATLSGSAIHRLSLPTPCPGV